MILIFDLDDTLYPEITYVESGFRAVAAHLEMRFGWAKIESFEYMMNVLKNEGRGSVFNSLLKWHSVYSKSLVLECLKKYRHHNPAISLFPSAVNLLASWAGPLYLVTDGHKIVQQKKVDALNITSIFKKIYITHCYGLKHAKPSIHCFDLIRKIEQCDWQDMVYVGDNPAKDFVNLTPLGVHTIRILSGHHSEAVAMPGFEASQILSSFDNLPNLLSMLKETS